MIRIAKLTDYGFVLLAHVARTVPGTIHTARELSEQAQLPLPTVSKLLKALVGTGILVSHRGTRGGYALARSPAEISVVEIIESIEGPIALTECGSGDGQCGIEADCATRSHWGRISRAVHAALQALSLADMAQPLPGGWVGPIPLPTKLALFPATETR
jgi:FeS assembly SUF system regulator